MFITKTFTLYDIENKDALSIWLNALHLPGYGVRVVSQVVVPSESATSGRILTTVSRWKFQEENTRHGAPVRTTIDEIPEDPTIDLSSDNDADA